VSARGPMKPLHWRRDPKVRTVHRAWAWGVGDGLEPTPDGNSFRALPDYYRIRPLGRGRRIVELVRPGGGVVAVLATDVPTVREAKEIAEKDYAARRRQEGQPDD